MDRGELDSVTENVIGFTIKIHKTLGPGFVERIYEKALLYEFQNANIKFQEQAEVKVKYENIELGYQRVDFIIDGAVIVELKAVSEMNEIHEAQLLSYLKTAGLKVGLLLNFAKKKLDIKRVVNKY